MSSLNTYAVCGLAKNLKLPLYPLPGFLIVTKEEVLILPVASTTVEISIPLPYMLTSVTSTNSVGLKFSGELGSFTNGVK